MYLNLGLISLYPNPPVPGGDFHHCVSNIILERIGDNIQNMFINFQRPYNMTLRYLRALRVVDRVVDAVFQHKLSDQCWRALMRMTHCASCAGYSRHTQICNGLCLNTFRGCLLDLGDLVAPIQQFSQALVSMKNTVITSSIYNQITLLGANAFFIVDSLVSESQFLMAEVSSFT